MNGYFWILIYTCNNANFKIKEKVIIIFQHLHLPNKDLGKSKIRELLYKIKCVHCYWVILQVKIFSYGFFLKKAKNKRGKQYVQVICIILWQHKRGFKEANKIIQCTRIYSKTQYKCTLDYAKKLLYLVLVELRTQEVDKALNVAKSFIYKCRFLKSIPTVNKFMPFLKSRYIVE